MRALALSRPGLTATVLLAGALLGLIVAVRGVSAGGASVAVEAIHAGPEQVSEVDLVASGLSEPGLAAWTVDIHYDPEILDVEGCQAGLGGICNAAFDSETVRVAGTNVLGLTGNNVLATIAFSCDQLGESELELDLDVFADATPGGPQAIDAAVKNAPALCKEEAKPTEPAPKLLGDVDCDGEVDTIDAVLLLQYGAAMIDELPCADSADVNEDGEINSLDAVLILQKVAGLID